MIKVSRILIIIIALLAFAGLTQGDIVEGFDPGGGQYVALESAPRTSQDTGYVWSGYHGGALWDLVMWDAKELPVGEGVLNISGKGAANAYSDVNVWAVFNGDFVEDLSAVKFEWLAEQSVSGNMLVRAVIQDAADKWYVSEDSVVDTAGTTQTIYSKTTAWRV